MIALSDEYLSKLYPVESNHLESVAGLAAPNVAVFGAYVGQKLVACVASKVCEDDERYAEVKRLFVLESHRGAGIAQVLMRRVEDDARANGIFLVRLETGIKQPAAIGLYEKLGYAARGPFGPYGDDPLSVFMEKRLADEAASTA
ncbi:MAG TPA: GNAT family N-acetyltransferase [Gammaproteobacteria bacterium]